MPAFSGYSINGNLGGTLSPDEFVLEGTTYRVQFLAYSSESLWLGVYPELSADFTLKVGASTYLGSESMVPGTASGAGGYWWPASAPDWLGDDPFEVALIIDRDVALGDRQKAPVTGYFRYFPTEHDWTEDVSFRICFSEGIAATADALRDHVLSISGGTVSSFDPVVSEGSEGRIWAVSVTPTRGEPITVRVESDLDCALPGAICTADGRRLFNRMELTVEAKAYHPPAGAPVISGTVEAGETLTADASGISDADGLSGATFSYQWMSYDGNAYTDIPGATDSTHTVVPADAGKSFKLRVAFTDDAGYEESLTSALFGSGRPYGLTASVSDNAVLLTWKLPAGWPYSSTFQILRNRPELGEAEPLVHVRYTGSGANTYTDTDVEPGVLHVYRVKGVDPFGFPREASEAFEIRTPVSMPAENRAATGAPSIGGAAQVGETLTADTSGIADEDGLAGATYSYQWLADDAVIRDATDSTYVLDAADAGKAVRVRVSFTDDGGNEETSTSAPTAQVAHSSNNLAMGLPTIKGQARVGATLRVSLSALDDPDGLFGVTFRYQWLADDEEVRDATGSTYVPDVDDAGKAIKVRVSFTDGGRNEETLTSAATIVETVGNSPATGTPSIGGAAHVGETLSADTSGISDEDGMDNAAFSYQWLADDADIRDATDSIYVLDGDDAVKSIKVSVSFTDDAGNEETLTSAATAAVTARPVPLTARILDATTSHDGQNAFTFELRFNEDFGLSYVTLRDHAFAVVGGAVTKARRLAPPGNVRWEVTVVPDSDADVTVVLPATVECGDAVAICTGDGRALSARLAITVEGPR